jgi:hypothetical protein
MTTVLLIHEKPIASRWLLLAAIPPLVGAYFCFWR